MFSEMEYPHWMMVAGAWLVAGFRGLGFSRYMNRASAEDNLAPGATVKLFGLPEFRGRLLAVFLFV